MSVKACRRIPILAATDHKVPFILNKYNEAHFQTPINEPGLRWPYVNSYTNERANSNSTQST